MNPDTTSDGTFRLAKIRAKAVAVLKSDAAAKTWLSTPNQALGDQPPSAVMLSDAGAKRVFALLDRMKKQGTD